MLQIWGTGERAGSEIIANIKNTKRPPTALFVKTATPIPVCDLTA